MNNKITLIGDLAYGDCGKGRIVDLLIKNYDVVARFSGGNNCGHVLVVNGIKRSLHLIPSGVLYPEKKLILGSGMVIDPISLMEEIIELEKSGLEIKSRLYISNKAHLTTPAHRMLDEQIELMKGKNKIGSTKKGIGPTYTDKAARIGIRIEDVQKGVVEEKYQKILRTHANIITDKLKDTLKDFEQDWNKSIEYLSKLNIVNCEYFIDELLKSGNKILAEGAQGTLLDVDFGTYPYVTSSNNVSGSVCAGLGVSPNKIGHIYGITKAYMTRVGNGFFTTELHDEIGEKIAEIGHEYGSTTGRKRRCGWLDMPALKYACMINGVDSLIITKVDVLDTFEEIKVCESYSYPNSDRPEYKFNNDEDLIPNYKTFEGWKTKTSDIRNYEDLPIQLKNYIEYIENYTGVKIEIVSVGPDRNEIIMR
jgi:adenylosuccinate synthase